MTAKLVGTSSLIDECLSIHDFSAVYELRIDVPPPVIYESLLNSDFSEPWLVAPVDEYPQRKTATA